MIVEYHRPKDVVRALELLARPEPRTVPLAGGSALIRPGAEPRAVVDLQDLGLHGIAPRGNFLELGAMATLQDLLDLPALPQALAAVIRHEATYNLRQVATVGGTLVAADGRSPFATASLALDARLDWLPGEETVDLGDLLPVRESALLGRLITRITIPLNAGLSYQYVARTPADWPLVCVAISRWPSGRTRVALGGFGQAPVLAFDGPDAGGIEAAVRDACSQAGDRWASAEYRQESAALLARRALAETNPISG